MKKIILVGYMGSGKTTVGKKLNQNLNIDFIDLDEFIEQKEGLKMAKIFKRKGEIYFRKQENIWLNQLLKENKSLIISLGGGTPCYANNHLRLQDENVISFYLKASIETLVSRLKQNSDRPLLENIDDLNSFVGQHVLERSYFYNFSKYKIDVNNKEVDDICLEISSIIQNNN
ncbi:shikimate kinase [Paenimyroides baculatum]|uniref:Shikimate kinase n=1 Tax=Paenimyroides baculatum TaxID=2608000 RepID=A0A5M6CGU0_9FLAO|nr:shikimate kinase [Paenimyroides baculatum]KAA5534237.1 shikimate kinase [Paenimyroides baculatum]